MKHSILLFLILFNLQLFSQGSGSALDFDGSSQYITIPASPNLNPTNEISIEAWYRPTISWVGNGIEPIILKSFTSHTAPYYQYGLYAIGDLYGNPFYHGQFVFLITNSSNTIYSVLTPLNYFNIGEYYHIAGTYDGTILKLYVNGELISSSPATGNIASFNTGVEIGKLRNYNTYLPGNIDEVKIWDTALTQSEIRDWMCKKITSSHPQYSNLVAYYRFDENTGTTLTDSAGSNNGTLVNSPSWILSKAPIGDESAYQYSGSPSVSLSHPDGDNFTINSFTGSPTGAHIYLVNEYPNSLTGTQGVGLNNKYFGVYKVGDNAATYTATYNYTGNPYVNSSEPDLKLYKRLNNSVSTWNDASATLNVVNNTLIALGENTEYILGSIGSPLPIELLNFTAKITETNSVKLNWNTVSEINNDYFIIQRSKNGMDWEELERINGAGNSTGLLKYFSLDKMPYNGISYYRLKQTDFDGQFEYSDIREVHFKKSTAEVVIYPNPTNNQITILANKQELSSVKIYNTLGQDVTNLTRHLSKTDNSTIIDLSSLSKGLYNIKTLTTAKKVYKK